MAKRIIECQVNDEYVLGSGVVVGAAGSHDDVVLRLAFGEMWVGYNIYATFLDANGENPVHSMLMASMLVPGEAMTYDVTIPPEAKRHAGKMMLTLTGYSIVDGVEEDMATNTTTAYFRVLPSDFTPLDDGTVTPTLAQQVQNELGEYYSVFKEQYSKIEGVENAENDRKTAEEGRALAEEARIAAEGLRIEAESARASAENNRQLAEEERNELVGDLDKAVDKILKIQQDLLDGDAEVIAKAEVIKAINETLLIANDLETDDPYKALSAAQGVVLNDIISNKVQIEGNYYNGSNTDYGPELMFSFVPKIIFIFKRIRTYSNTFVENISGGQIIVVPEMGLTTSDYAAEKVKVTLNGTIVSLETKGIITPVVSEVCNVQSYHYNTNHTQKIADKKEDGYGYWYYGIG